MPSIEAQRLLKHHTVKVKAVRSRGEEVQPTMAARVYLEALEEELDGVRQLLNSGWAQLDDCRDYKKCARHLDRAQQRMHRMLKRLAKRGGNR